MSVDKTILDRLAEASECNGIYDLEVEKNSLYQKWKQEKSLPEWRVTMAEMFLYDFGIMFMSSVSGKETKQKRIAKEAVRMEDGKWVLDTKVLMSVESVEEIKNLNKLLSIAKDNLKKTPHTRIMFCNEYDDAGRIFLSVNPQIKVDGKITEVSIPELEEILQNELKDWQKRFAKSLRTMGRYSFAIVSAEDLYGKREVFNMYD